MAEVSTGKETLVDERKIERAERKARIKAAKERDKKNRNDLLRINKQLQNKVREQKLLIKRLLEKLEACERLNTTDKSNPPDVRVC